MGSLKTARGSNEPFKLNLISAKIIKKKTILAEIKLRLNGSLDLRAVLSDPMAFDPIYLHKYFHIFIYFIHQVIAYFSKHAARAIATLCDSITSLGFPCTFKACFIVTIRIWQSWNCFNNSHADCNSLAGSQEFSESGYPFH